MNPLLHCCCFEGRGGGAYSTLHSWHYCWFTVYVLHVTVASEGVGTDTHRLTPVRCHIIIMWPELTAHSFSSLATSQIASDSLPSTLLMTRTIGSQKLNMTETSLHHKVKSGALLSGIEWNMECNQLSLLPVSLSSLDHSGSVAIHVLKPYNTVLQ